MKRRDLSFSTLDDLLADIQALLPEGLSSSGNWTPAGNVDHVQKTIRFSAAGFPEGKAPWLLRMMFRLMVKVMGDRVFTKPLEPGKFKLPESLNFFEPEEGLSWPDAVARLEESIAMARNQGMTHPSPLAGKLTHKQWTMLHCRHAELHFSLIHPAQA